RTNTTRLEPPAGSRTSAHSGRWVDFYSAYSNPRLTDTTPADGPKAFGRLSPTPRNRLDALLLPSISRWRTSMLSWTLVPTARGITRWCMEVKSYASKCSARFLGTPAERIGWVAPRRGKFKV